MINNLIQGSLLTALITPFKENKPDLYAIEKLLNFQCLSDCIDGIVLFGTTGEPLSLSLSEKKIIFYTAKEIIKDKIPLICSVSDVNTFSARTMAQNYTAWGADGIMVINPYYYITTEEGIFRHFECICNSTNLPVVLYNVPARTNCDFSCKSDLIYRLSQIGNIVAIKQCMSDIKSFKNIVNFSNFKIYCGSDNEMLKMLLQGCFGCISVCSLICPELVKSIIKNVKLKDFKNAEALFLKLNKLNEILNKCPNPISIKYMASKIFNINYELRLPLVPPSAQIKKEMDNFIKNNKEMFK